MGIVYDLRTHMEWEREWCLSIEVPTALFQNREGKMYSTYRKGRI
jgi:hypothetical protein